jgi:hypothetical protein
MDIEGLCIDDNFLWIVGSHSLTRDKPKRKKSSSEESLEELADLDRDSNRYFLGRLPLVEDSAGTGYYGVGARGAESQAPARSAEGSEAPDSAEETLRTAAALKMTGRGNALTKALKKDRHLGPFLSIPAKENGFDIEGVAVSGNRVALGLRGPVLRGWACILELHLGLPKPHHLKAKKIGSNGERHLKHLANLDGLGIRDLKIDGEDLLILAGPTMDLEWISMGRPRFIAGPTGSRTTGKRCFIRPRPRSFWIYRSAITPSIPRRSCFGRAAARAPPWCSAIVRRSPVRTSPRTASRPISSAFPRCEPAGI